MAVEELTAEREIATRPRMPWWLGVILVFAASRVVSTAMLLWFAAHQQVNSWTAASPSYQDFARIWDGNWFWIVADQGYPSTLPVGSDGHVSENAWAFLPGYPFFVKLIGLITGTDFTQIAWIVSLAFALGAALLFYRLMIQRLPSGSALFAVALFCFSPVSAVLQVDYAESMFSFLLVLCLLLLSHRRYALIAPVAILLAFTRPGALALALTLGVHIILRWRNRRTDPFPAGEAVAAIVTTIVTGLAGIAWPIIAWLATGDPKAYTETELAWRASYLGYADLLPFAPWVQGANWWAGFWGWPAGLGVVALVVLVAAFGVWMFTPWMKRMGTDIRVWTASYALYLLAVFFPQSSTFRILLPLFPAYGGLAVPKSKTFRIVLIAVFIALQWWWLTIAWKVDVYDWTPP